MLWKVLYCNAKSLGFKSSADINNPKALFRPPRKEKSFKKIANFAFLDQNKVLE